MSDEEVDDLSFQPKPSKLPLLLGAVNVLLTIVVAVRVMTMSPGEVVAVPQAEAAPDSGGEDDEPGPTVALDPFVVNLNEVAGSRFLKLVIEVEVFDDKAAEKLTARTRKVRDEMLRYLSSLTVEATMGEDNKVAIKDELKKRLMAAVGEGKIKTVYLVEFVVQ